jgi:hypothetical protein
MATCSITDPFVVDANDFYKAVAESKEAGEEMKKQPDRPRAKSRRVTEEDMKKLLEKI